MRHLLQKKKNMKRFGFYFPFEAFFFLNWYRTNEKESFSPSRRNGKKSFEEKKKNVLFAYRFASKTHLTVSESPSWWWKGMKNGNRRNHSTFLNRNEKNLIRKETKPWSHGFQRSNKQQRMNELKRSTQTSHVNNSNIVFCGLLPLLSTHRYSLRIFIYGLCKQQNGLY